MTNFKKIDYSKTTLHTLAILMELKKLGLNNSKEIIEFDLSTLFTDNHYSRSDLITIAKVQRLLHSDKTHNFFDFLFDDLLKPEENLSKAPVTTVETIPTKSNHVQVQPKIKHKNIKKTPSSKKHIFNTLSSYFKP